MTRNTDPRSRTLSLVWNGSCAVRASQGSNHPLNELKISSHFSLCQPVPHIISHSGNRTPSIFSSVLTRLPYRSTAPLYVISPSAMAEPFWMAAWQFGKSISGCWEKRSDSRRDTISAANIPDTNRTWVLGFINLNDFLDLVGSLELSRSLATAMIELRRDFGRQFRGS